MWGRRVSGYMAENKRVDLSFEFVVAVVHLVGGIPASASACMINPLAQAGPAAGRISIRRSRKGFAAKMEIAL